MVPKRFKQYNQYARILDEQVTLLEERRDTNNENFPRELKKVSMYHEEQTRGCREKKQSLRLDSGF
jgi:hypothetical protein